MNQDLKDQLHELASQIEKLSERATSLCKTADPSNKVDSVSSALFNLQRNNDFVFAVTNNDPPGDMVVRLKLPDTRESVRLEARWSTEAKCFRLSRVPIDLAAVARAIDSELADHTHTGMVSFSWDAIPVEIDEILE